jgi:hypothetical protein
MKKILSLIAIATLVGVTAKAADDDKKATAGPTLSVGVDAGLPLGTLGDVYSFAIGGSAKAAIPAGPGAVTISAGYLNFSGKTISGFKVPSTYLIPLKGGYRFNLGEGGFNLEPFVGYSVGKGGGGGFTYGGNIGYLINNQIDLSAGYNGLSAKGGGGSSSWIGFRAAYSFSLGK